MAERRDFDEFVVTRSSRLLRTAFLLTRDWALAEDLLQTALAKSWFAWGRLDDNPEPYVRKVLVNTYASWWRRRWRAETPTESLPDSHVHGPDPTAQVDDRDELWHFVAFDQAEQPRATVTPQPTPVQSRPRREEWWQR